MVSSFEDLYLLGILVLGYGTGITEKSCVFQMLNNVGNICMRYITQPALALEIEQASNASRRCSGTYPGVLDRGFDLALSSVKRSSPATASVCIIVPAVEANEIHIRLPKGVWHVFSIMRFKRG